ncbi:Crotonobetainyl-CoA dehydrogenase [compost metagenome]|jgi:alkylation response protein AidB-like acyl-CoA dehydrogenase|uniref:acyl-CoA dehydrogenase family protein n=1 Tax=Metapseudomonas furukawaii TaxID=1149133 RepID=UPI00227B8DD9|nr:acyl-CoA dehydrogenase family protein [Pseudomonas furukawaii]WAG81117.1 acyl-CoA dehydrogenase family protein [Pseudomonas furukawaii]
MNHELKLYRERARAWLAEHAPQYSGQARHGLSFDDDLALARAWQAHKVDHGYGCITLPREYGGAGGSELEKVIFCEEEMRYDLPLVYFSISLNNPLPIFLRYAPEAWKQKLGPATVRGELIWCQLFSEPSAGSDLASLRLKAVPTEGGWLLSGQKVWTSWAQIADWGVVVTRTDPSLPKHAGLTYFFLDMKSPGITVQPIRRLGEEKDLNEVFFDEVFVPDEQRLGEINGGFKVAVETLMIERYAVTDESGYGPTLEKFVDLAGNARINGRPALEDGEVRSRIAEIFVERQGLRAIHRRALEAFARGEAPGPEGAIRKLLLGRTRQSLGAMAMDLLGANGAQLAPHGHAVNDFARAWLDPSLRIAGGTDELLLNTLAERVLGLPQDHRPDKGIPFNAAPK